MGLEIERKFVVNGDDWRLAVIDRRTLRQGYVAIDGGNTVRVRSDGERAWLTIKGPQNGLSRPEFEYEIPNVDAAELLTMCRGRLVEKNRHRVSYSGRVWEIDEFLGANEGLVVAEIELTDQGEQFACPNWLGKEVSDDPRYMNASLSIRPFSQWAGETA